MNRRPIAATTALPTNSKRGGDRDRTGDLLLAKQALSQLSYSPYVGLNGFEPLTPRLSSACSNQLSYRPNFNLSDP